MKKYLSLHILGSFLLRNRVVVFFFLATLILFYINSFHEQYPDEFDNLLGGWYILRGILPFSGFFSHHGPIAYFVSAIVQLFSGHSFVSFRVVYNLFLVFSIFAFYSYLHSRFGKVVTKFYLYFAILLGIAATYFWGQMLLADTLSAYFLTPVFILFLLKHIYKERIVRKDMWLISILTAAGLLTSLTYIYLCAVIYIFLIYSYYLDYRRNLNKRDIMKSVGILALPYVIFFAYLLITRSLGDYVYQSIIFNQKYYIYNYPGLVNGHINPIRFAIVIFHSFYQNFFALLVQLSGFNFANPFNITLAVINVSLIINSLFKKNYGLAFFIILYMVYANARTNPLDSKETDYQSAVYIMMSLVNLCFILPMLFNESQIQVSNGKRMVTIGLFLVCAVYSFFTVGWLTNKFFEKAYDKYMGTAPLIYDRPNYANLINAVIGKNDYIWIGPLEFQEYYYVNGKLASKYHILIPGMGHSEKIQKEFLADMNVHMPQIIVFKKNEGILGSPPSEFAPYFINFLTKNYVTLLDYTNNGVTYTSVKPVSNDYDIEANLYINKQDAPEVINKLLTANIIKYSP